MVKDLYSETHSMNWRNSEPRSSYFTITVHKGGVSNNPPNSFNFFQNRVRVSCIIPKLFTSDKAAEKPISSVSVTVSLYVCESVPMCFCATVYTCEYLGPFE